MLRRPLESLGRVALARPLALLLAVVTPALILSGVALTVPVDLSFTGIMDSDDPEVSRYLEASERFGLGGDLMLLIEGPEDKLDGAVGDLASVLESQPQILAVLTEPSTDWLRQRAPWLVEREVFDAWIRLVTHPEDMANTLFLARRLQTLEDDQARFRVPGARILQVKMASNPLDLALGGDQFLGLERATSDALQGTGVEASYSGLPAVAAQDQSRTLRAMQRLTPLSLLVVLFIFRFVERRWSGLLVVIGPLLLAVGATLGFVGLLTGRLTIMETFFGVTVFGLGIDFAIHLIVRQREERARGMAFDQALRTNLVGAGRGVVAGALTTAGAFFIVAAAPDPVALHLGLSGGVGLMFCLVLMITVLPAAWTLLEQRRARRPAQAAASSALPIPIIPTLARHAVVHPWLHVLIAVFLLVIAALGLPRFAFETDLQKVFNRNVPAVETVHRVQQLFGLTGAPWIVGVDDLDEARRVTNAFAADPHFTRADSLANLVPVDAAERGVQLAAVRDMLDSRIATLEAQSRGEDASGPQVGGQLLAGYRVLRQAATVGPPAADDLPAGLRRRLIGPGGEILVLAYSAQPSMDGLQARVERLAAQAIHPEASGVGVILEITMARDRPWVWTVLFAIAAFVALVLLVDLRDARLTALAIVPVLIGVTLTVGILCWSGIAFNVMTTLVVPLIIGLGVDDGIHVVHRIKEDPSLPVDVAATSVGRAIVLTTATTCSSFAVLLFTDHPGLETMGLVMLIGLPICLAASVTTLPALASLILRRRAPA